MVTKAPGIPIAQTAGSMTSAFGGILSSGVTTNKAQQLSTFNQVGWLFAVISRIAEAVASSEWQLYKRKGRNRKNWELIEDHPLMDLWDNPNPFLDRNIFFEVSQMYLELTGECPWLIVRGGSGLPVELWPLRPDTVRPIRHPTEFITGYMYKMGSFQTILQTEDIIHIKKPSPVDIYQGMSIIQALYPDLDADRYAAEYRRMFFNNSAEPGGILEFEQGLTDEQRDQTRRNWADHHKGTSKAHTVAIIERGKWVERKTSSKDMQWEQGRRFGRDTIIGAFGVPLSVMGIAEDVNRANAEAGEVSFGRWTVKPRLLRIQRAANTKLVPAFGEDLRLIFDNPVPDDNEFNLGLAERGYNSGFLTQNESRNTVGFEDVDGGDEFKSPPPDPFGLGTMGDEEDDDESPEDNEEEEQEEDQEKSLSDWRISGSTIKSIAGEERRIRRQWRKRLRVEFAEIMSYLSSNWETGKSTTKMAVGDIDLYNWDGWEKYGEDVVDERADAFDAVIGEQLPGGITDHAHSLSVQYAEKRGAQLLKLTGSSNMVTFTRKRVQTLVAETLDKGDSLQTLQKKLREDVAFSRQRAETVARTETATALGQGAKEAAVISGRNEKHWRTQFDDRVDADCLKNEEQGWIPIGDMFFSGQETVPAHPSCRCVVSYRTNEDRSSPRFEVRCADCNKLLDRTPINPMKGPQLRYCPRCKKQTGSVGYVLA